MFAPLITLTVFSTSIVPTIDEVLPIGLKDAWFTAHVVRGSEKELGKINSDFAQAYRFVDSEVRLRDPFQLRIDTELQDTKVTFIVNGPTKVFRIPRSNLNIHSHVDKKPGQRQTWLDFGIVAASLFESLFEAKFIAMDFDGSQEIFDATYRARNLDTSRQRLWIDVKKRIVVRRVWYDQTNKLKATFVYSDPIEQVGIWFPTRMVVSNADGVVAGETEYRNVKINSGIAESAFSVK